MLSARRLLWPTSCVGRACGPGARGQHVIVSATCVVYRLKEVHRYGFLVVFVIKSGMLKRVVDIKASFYGLREEKTFEGYLHSKNGCDIIHMLSGCGAGW